MILEDGLTITNYDIVSSTSDIAAEAAREGAQEGAAFRAKIQTEGRGRHGRNWSSPQGNLYVSVVLYPQRPLAEWASLSLVASLALADALARFRPSHDIRLKWPNDVLYKGLKCAGLLLEKKDNAVILGLGVNINAAPAAVDGWPAGCINDNDDEASYLTADDLMEAFAEALVMRYRLWSEKGFTAQREDWHSMAAHLGQGLVIDRGEGEMLKGVFHGLNEDGSLGLRDADGRLSHLTAGDILKVRPA